MQQRSGCFSSRASCLSTFSPRALALEELEFNVDTVIVTTGRYSVRLTPATLPPNFANAARLMTRILARGAIPRRCLIFTIIGIVALSPP